MNHRIVAKTRPSRMFKNIERYEQERIRAAGKHTCVSTKCGDIRRLIGRNDKTLKRPVVIMRFYECKVCGRNMTPDPA